MRRVVSLLLIIALSSVMFVGCSGKKQENNGEVSADGGVVISKVDINFLDADGAAIYNVVRPEANEFDEIKLASLVFKQAKSKIGVAGKTVIDSADGTGAYEILIGATNRPESQQAMDYLKSKSGGRYDDFIICTIGKKIVINANNAKTLEIACNYFIENFLKPEGVKGGIEYVCAAQGNFVDITINGKNISEFCFVRPHFNYSYLAQVEVTKLVQTVYEKTGYMLKVVHDEYVAEGENEIVVGNTNRKGVKSLTDYDQYDISVSGSKVYLNGGSAHATAMAVYEFAKVITAGSITDSTSITGSYETAFKNYDAATTYYPVYYDNFDGDTIDTTKWRLMSGTEFGRDGQNGKYSGMTDDPNYVFQSDGKFYIYGHENDKGYWGGTLTNSTTMAFQYGFVEHSVICPDGDGFWSLLWFSSTGDGTNQYYSAEIDLNECFGNGRATQANCHKWPTSLGKSLGLEHESLDGKQYGAAKKYYCPDEKTWADDYHTFGFLWDETQMTFTADGDIWFAYDITTKEYDIDAFVNTYLYMKLSFSVGRLNNSLLVENLTDEEWQNSSVLICDWLYLYQLDNGKQTLKLK
ncbi:MAG: family 16 glycosylhydrolase [Clostridia bacterium]|nr:family 16 glycosylhydrolase [Clostridia bacterium]MBO5912293.1 family 16 glycosylhydrolase [Clostridia bacterium]